jgi:hypothetical protein
MITLQNHADSKQKSSKIMKMKMFAILDKAKPDTGNTKGLNLAAAMFKNVQMSRLPLWPLLLVSSRAKSAVPSRDKRGLVCIIYIVYIYIW